MNKKLLTMGTAILLTLVLTGAALAAVPGNADSPRFGRMMGGLVGRVAEFLGLEIADVQEAKSNGQTLADILGDQKDAFIAKTIAERQEMLNAMVESGKITAEQAAECQELMGSRLEERLTSEGQGCHGAPGRGGMMKNTLKRMMQQRNITITKKGA